MKPSRNDICPYCNSGKKYKKCHLLIENTAQQLEDLALQKWLDEDLKTGQERIQEMEKAK